MVNEGVVFENPVVETDYETERNKPMPTRIHGTIQSRINFLLQTAYGDRYDFPNEVSLNTLPPTTPDILVYPKKKLSVRETAAKEQEMPITTIEILSPSQTVDELAEKAWNIYFPAGVQSAWLVVPQLKTVSILSPTNGKSRIARAN